MSAINERAISHIKDEDLLKKMWQETEDFGKKKEIRAHMYKLREERLKDLYSSSEVKDVHMITNKKTSFNQSMHADALADHSFASLKRKEIRDSESPTKEVSYKMKGPSSNEGWNISKIEEHSQDGKNHRFQQSAHTSGTEYIPQGKLDFEAKNSQEVTSFQDGDQNNFVKSQGASSNSFIRQEAVGGDENSSFRTSSTQSSSSSRKVTEQRSTHGDAIDYPRTELLIEGVNRHDQKNSRKLSTCNDSSVIYTEKKSSGDDVSNYPRKQIVVESIGKNDQSNLRASSTNTTSSSKTVTERKSYDDYSRKPIQISDDIVVDKTTKVYTTDAPRELKSHPGYVEGRTKITRETKTLADGTVVTTTKYETSGANELKSSSNHYSTSSSTFQDNKSNVITSKSHENKFSTQKIAESHDIQQQPKSRYYVEKTHTIPSNTESIHHNVHSRRESNVSEKKIDTSKNYQAQVDERYEVRKIDQNIVESKNTENVKKHSVQHIEIDDRRKDNIDIQKTQNIRKVLDNNQIQQKTVATHDVNSVPLGTPIEIEINLTRINDNQERRYETQGTHGTQNNEPRATKSTPSNEYDTPQKREPIKHESELITKTKKIEGNYDTTYKTDYTTKKISVEVSPTHDAFARSLRAVSPDRLSSRTSSRNLKTSNSSLRSSSSPEKSYTDRRHPQRMSPEGPKNGRCYSPTKKSPDKYSSTETITYRTSSRPSLQRISPDKNYRSKPSNEIKITSNISTITKKREKLDSRSPTKNLPRSSRPNDDEQHINVQEIITDLDDNVSTYSNSTITRTDKVCSTLDSKNINTISVNNHQKNVVEENSVKEPIRKDKPVDKPLKRTDTYEERCSQILGITSDTNERRRSSLEKLRKRSSTISSHTDSIPKSSPEKSVEVISSKKSSENPRQKSPTKQGSPLQEFPAQIRRSPEKYTPDRRGPKDTSPTKNRKTSVDRKPIQEFPSQKRYSPEKPETASPTRSSPRRTIDTRQERKPSSECEQVQEYPSQKQTSPEKYNSNMQEVHTKSVKRTRNPNERERNPSTRRESIREYPSQKRPSPEKQNKQSPNRSSPKSKNPDERERSPSTRTEPIGEYPSQKRPSPEKQNEQNPNRSSSRKILNNGEDISINEITRDDHFNSTTNITYQIRNDDSRNENIITEVRKSALDKKLGSKPSNEESSSEEENLEINERQKTEKVIYDIPRNTPIKNSCDNTLKTNTLIITTDEQNEVDVRKISTVNVSEDKNVTKNYQVETILNRENVDVENEGPRKFPENTKSDEDSYHKSTSSTRNFPSQDTLTNKISPKKNLPNVDKEMKVDSPKKLKPIEKNQPKPKLRDTYDEEIVEENENTIATSEKTSTDESVIKMRTVGELVKNFTVKGTEKLTEPTVNKRKPTIESPTPSFSKKPTTTDAIQRTINGVEISETSAKTPIDLDLCRSKSHNYQNFIEDSEHVGFVDLRKTNVDTVQMEVDSVTINTSSIENKKRHTSNQAINVSSISKKTVQNDKTKRRFDSEENRPDAGTDISEQRISQQTASDEICRTTPKTKKPLQKSSQRDYLEDQKNINIKIDEIIIIDSDEEITKAKHKKPASKKITDNFESDEEITEIREDNYTSEQKLKTDAITREIQSNEVSRKPTEKTTEQKVVHTSSIKTKNISKDKDSQRPTQRIPSSSSLSKKPVTPQRIDKCEELNNKRRHEVSTATLIIQSDQKLSKIDSMKAKSIPTSKQTKEILSKTNTTRKPTTKKTLKDVEKNKKPNREIPLEPNSDYSSEAEEEILTKKHLMETYEGRTPVEEPQIMKKTISLLYSDDEDDKKSTQLLIESEITDRQSIANHKSMKPVETTKTKTKKLISTEKYETITQKNKSSLKTSHQVNNQLGRKPIIEKKPELSKQTHSNDNNSNKRETIKRDNKQNTLKDIEKFENITQDKTIHLRSNRVDDTVNKKKSTVIIESNKPLNKYPKVSTTSRITNGNVPKKPSSKNLITIEKKTTKTKEPATLLHKTTKPLIQQKNTTNTSKSITQTKASKTSSQNVKIKTEEKIKSKPVPKKPKPEDSDEESLPDSLNENIYTSLDDLTSNIQKKGTSIESNATSYRITSTKAMPEDSEEKVRILKPTTEKKQIPKKSVINNSNRGATVDLQRSISSREATPDRMCPLPVTSDDEGFAPRYPDTVVEPDEGFPRRRYDKLLETSIHEYDDSIQSKKIVEINESFDKRVSEIDRVDNDDDSLLTVDRKINKFLSTAEKLTEKPVVDISQPAPKVERPKFVVNDDLKEDDCLLSVSDKVQKFITEAEHLTTQKDTQHRKSINSEKQSEISNRINQFTVPQQPQTNSSSPRKFSIPKNDQPSCRDTGNKQSEKHEPVFLATLGKTKLEQDVFISTECAEIEKESDFDRTSKRPSQSAIHPKKEPEHISPKITDVLNTKTINANTKGKMSTIKKTSTLTTEISDDDSEIIDQNQVEEQRDTSKSRKDSLKEFTPKNRRPSQEDKVILSSVSRLRSNESIKKTKALFENNDSVDREEKRQKDILNRPSVFEGRNKSLKETNSRKSIDRKSVTPKRLVFSSEKDTEENQEKITLSSETNRTETQIHIRSNGRESLERDVPGYMKPLDRSFPPESHKNSRRVPEDDHPKRKHPDQDGHPGSQTPGYMKPLDRFHQHSHNQDLQTRETHESKQSISHEDTQRYYSPNQHKESDDIPGYMKPLDRLHPHSHNENLQTRESHESRHSISHEESQSYHSSSKHKDGDDTPGYMKPLDRSHQHSHCYNSQTLETNESISREENQRYHSPGQNKDDDDTPGYMKPLDRTSRPQFENIEELNKYNQTKEHHERRKIYEDDRPGYMEPLDRSSRPQFENIEESHERHQTQDHHDRKKNYENDHPGYMEPLDRSSRPQFENTEKSLKRNQTQEHHERRKIYEDDHPGYMEPLDRSSRPQFEKIEESHQTREHHERKKINEDDHPGYMEPLDRSSRPQFENTEKSLERNKTQEHHERRKIFEDDHPGYMEPLDRSSRPQFENIEELHKRHQTQEQHGCRKIYENDHPGYMEPLDRSSRPQFEKMEESHQTQECRKIYEDDHPGYLEPLDRSSRPQFENIEESHKRHQTQEHHERRKIYENDHPGYMEPLDRSSRPQFEKMEESHQTQERRKIYEDDHPGYLEPLDRSSRPQFENIEESHKRHQTQEHHERRKIYENDHPGYMEPLDRSVRPNLDQLERSRSPENYTSMSKSIEHEQKNWKHETQQNLFGHKRPDRPESTEVPGYMKPLDRSSQHIRKNSSQSPEPQEQKNAPKHPLSEETSPTPSYMKPVNRSARPQSDKLLKSESPETETKVNKHRKPEDKPNYMKSLDRKDRTSRSQSPKKDVSKPKETAGTPTKFGITLKRTDSSKSVTNSTTTTTEHKHYLLMKKSITEEEIEEVYDLDVLEELLLKFTTYELRRKIRSQIRLVKKLISENKLEVTIQNIKNKSRATDQSQKTEKTEENNYIDRNIIRTTPTRKTQENHFIDRNKHQISEYRLESTRKESVSSTMISENKESRRSQSPGKKDKKLSNRKTPERATSERSSPERKFSTKLISEKNTFEERTSLQQSTYRNKGKEQPEQPTLSTKTASTNIFKSSLKKTEPKAKTPTSTTQPEWITQRNLKKTGTNEVVKRSSSTTKKQNVRSSSSQNSETTDLIASSYGIGPTDENGAPLFGLRALRAQNGNTKVQGTVMRSQYYSETGKEPVGEISYTEYSSDPRDLGVDANSTQNGEILSITTTQKYGYEDAPSLSQLTSTKEDCDSQTQKRKNSTKTSTITRKNSVKALTQKFVENAVEVSKNERQSSYPKAGLILRSSSFKNESAQDDEYSETSAEERIEQSVSMKSSKTVSGGTFLRNKSKVTGVQDAISRMKASDIEYGDTEQDIEAKDLLNKYLGTQVILSGIEGQVSRTGTSSTKATSLTTAAKSISRVTIVTMENGKEVTRTLTFEHPVTEEVLENVWDEQTLRYLLDQSTDYEERKRIRARLRHIMAEQEACTELVKQASQDQSSQSIDEVVETSRETVSEGPVTTTKVTKVSTQQHISKKPMSPFAKFRQLDKQNSLNTPPSTPRTPGGSPLFKFTDAALSQSASTIKDRLLYWCRMKTKEYENIQLDNFSSSWADGLAFCALVHHFLPDAFDYHALTPKERRHNFTLAFKVADEKADIAPLLDVDDMVATMRPDWKCVFTYVQSIYRRFKDED